MPELNLSPTNLTLNLFPAMPSLQFAVAVGLRGPQGETGEGVPPGGASTQLLIKQSSTDFDSAWKSLTGDVTISAAGVAAIGATKVTNAKLNADVFSTARSWSGKQTFSQIGRVEVVPTDQTSYSLKVSKTITGDATALSDPSFSTIYSLTSYDGTVTSSQYGIKAVGYAGRLLVGFSAAANGTVIAINANTQVADYNSSGAGGDISEVAGSFNALNAYYTRTNHDANYWLADWGISGPTSGQERLSIASLFAAKYHPTETIDATHRGFYGWAIQSKPGSGPATDNKGTPVVSNLTTTSGSTSATVASATGIVAGMYVDCANVPAGTTILSIVGTSLTLSGNASATGTASATFRLITYRGKAAYLVNGFAGITGLTTDGASATATEAWEYLFAGGLLAPGGWLTSITESKYKTAFYARGFTGYGLEIDTRNTVATGHAIYTHSDAGNVGLGAAPDSSYRLRVSGGGLFEGGTLTASKPLSITQTWNDSGTTFTGLKFAATDTASAAGSLLFDFQVGGISKIFGFKSGSLVIDPAGGFLVQGRGGLTSSSDGVLRLRNNGNNDFGRLQFGGATSSFPAIKRSSTEIQVRLADDSGPAPLRFSYITKAGAFTNTDIATGECAVGYDSSGGTRKLYVNQGGTLYSVALS
jgi:hypothetical protein